MDEREKRLAERLTEQLNRVCGVDEETGEFWTRGSGYRTAKALWSECLRLMAQQEWVKVSPETMPEPHTSWLIAWHNYGTGNIVEEAYWNGEHWCLTRTNPCDEPIYLDEQVYAYTKIPDAPGLPTEGGKE